MRGWSAAGPGLPGSTPLHLSDAPPNADDPHTLFTAYSWPDARIGGHADHRLQTIMATLLEAPTQPSIGSVPSSNRPLQNHLTLADNDWSRPGSQRGSALCPENAILPLTDDLSVLRQAVNGLRTVCVYPECTPTRSGNTGATYIHLGVVWALRTLSPLWQAVWQVRDLQGAAVPAVSCARGESDENCDSRLTKSILIISDGANFPSFPINARLRRPTGAANAGWGNDLVGNRRFMRKYHAAAQKESATEFNGQFSGYLDQGTFGGAGMGALLDAFRILDPLADSPERRSSRRAVLETLTPWQLFRGLDAGVSDALMDSANEFGFERRPVQTEHFFRRTTIFGPYGRADDHVYVGNSATLPAVPLPPVEDESPFNLVGLAQSTGMRDYMIGTLDRWLMESCRIAGQRGVRIDAIYIGKASHTGAINTLERCVDAAGGVANKQEVLVTPDAATLEDAVAKLFTIRRNLQFLN